MCIYRPGELIRIEYCGECNMYSGSNVIVRQSVAFFEILYLALVLCDVRKRVEARGGMMNVATDRET